MYDAFFKEVAVYNASEMLVFHVGTWCWECGIEIS